MCAYGANGYEGIAVIPCRNLKRVGLKRDNVMIIICQGAYTLHERMAGIKCPQILIRERQGCAVYIGRIAIRDPPAIHAVGLIRPIEAKTLLHYNPAAVDVVGKVVAQRITVKKGTIAKRDNDIVLLQRGEIRRRINSIEQADRRNARFTLQGGLQLCRSAATVRIEDQH